jgi:hypothetical protein
MLEMLPRNRAGIAVRCGLARTGQSGLPWISKGGDDRAKVEGIVWGRQGTAEDRGWGHRRWERTLLLTIRGAFFLRLLCSEADESMLLYTQKPSTVETTMIDTKSDTTAYAYPIVLPEHRHEHDHEQEKEKHNEGVKKIKEEGKEVGGERKWEGGDEKEGGGGCSCALLCLTLGCATTLQIRWGI